MGVIVQNKVATFLWLTCIL